MSIRYAAGKYHAAAGTRGAFAGLSADLEQEGHPAIVVNDGDRELQDEIDMFLSRFRPQASGAGAFNDVRYWNGVRYVRFSPLGTVAPPGTGNHGKRRAGDLGYPYNSDTAAHRRAQVLAKRHNITCEGMGFREWWHWTFWGPLGTITVPAASGSSSTITYPAPEFSSEEDDMIRINSPKHGYAVIGAGHFRELKTQEEIDASVSIVSRSVTGTDRQFEVWRDTAMRSDFGPLAEGVWNHLLPAQDENGALIPGVTYKAGSMQASSDSRILAGLKKLLGK